VNRRSGNLLAIALVFITLAALLLLASSLSTVEFSAGKELPVSNLAPEMNLGQQNNGPFDSFMNIFRIMMIIAWVLLPIYAIYLILSKEARKRLLHDLLIIIPLVLLLYFFSNNISKQMTGIVPSLDTSIQSPQEGESQQAAPLPEFQPPPAWVTTVASLVLWSATVVAISLALWNVWRHRRQKKLEPLKQIGRQAQEAIDQLEAGGDLREIIQRCYRQMIIVLRDYRLIHRDQDMTPHEFEQMLEHHGLPREPIRQLTELFERVRYGAYSPDRSEEHIAISSLSAIVRACQSSTSRPG
jgi:beta-lactamase regulating signal transducer with metallopeptidase domain